jgi:outer membrane immunogenic protein
LVVGAEGDIDWQNVRGTQVGAGCSAAGKPFSCDTASNWVGTFRGRVGFAMDRVLLYATGGGAYANIKSWLGKLPQASSTELGWSSGLGVEVAMTDNWTAKVEYLAVGFEKASCGFANCMATPPVSVSFYESMVRGGINYKF